MQISNIKLVNIKRVGALTVPAVVYIYVQNIIIDEVAYVPKFTPKVSELFLPKRRYGIVLRKQMTSIRRV